MRLFLALWPDAVVRQQLLDAQARWDWPRRAVLVPPERLHLTLHFLGDVAEAKAAALRERLPALPEPFELQLGAPALWPPGTAVLAAQALPPGLAALHAALADILRRVGLGTESSAFRPHVTLARRAQGVHLPSTLPSWRWPVNGYALVHSRSGPPPRYELLQRVGA